MKHPDQQDSPQPGPFWNFVSIAAPLLGFAWLALRTTGGDPGDMQGGLRILLVIAVSVLVGSVAAGIAAFRREAPVALTVGGVLMNLSFLAMLIYRIVSHS
jgi:hypothetical protein